MNNTSHHIPVDDAALDKTLVKCHIELETLQDKQNLSFWSLILRYLYFDFRMFLFFSLGALFIVLLMISTNVNFIKYFLPIYFFLLGLLTLCEYYKSKYYQVLEIITPVFLNSGRVLIIKNASIAIMELMLFIILTVPLYALELANLSDTISICLIPLYSLQILFMNLLPIIKGYISALTIYTLAYIFYYVLYTGFLIHKVPLSLSIILVVAIICIYIISGWRLYLSMQKNGEKNYGTTIGTY